MQTRPTNVDLAIIGSGPVGIALASALADTGIRIAIIEAGGHRQDKKQEEESLAASFKSPQTHPEAHLFRRRMLGGSSTVWGGRCLPYDRIDMQPLAERPGWPIGFGAVAPYMSQALTFLDAGENVYDEAAFVHPTRMNQPGVDLELDTIERFSKPTNAWRKAGGELKARTNITVMSNTLARELVADPASGTIRELDLVDTSSGTPFRLKVGHVVLACGGIENARLLLASPGVSSAGIGNEHDHVGRYYMTHIIGDIGVLALSDHVDQAKFDYRLTSDGVYSRTIIKLSEELRAREGLPNALWRPSIAPVWNPAHRSAIFSAMHFAKSLVAREYHQRLNEQGRGGGSKTGEGSSVLAHGLNIARNPFELFTFAQNWVRKRVLAERKLPSVFLLNSTRRYPMEINSEQFPERESRISLSDRVDRYGMPLINLNWHVGGDTLDGLRRAFQLFASTVEQSKIGHYTYQESEIETNFVPQGGHHIGTTRMAERAEDGVVDSNCTVFGVANLHIAGASVFTTSSCANPTLMGVAMALRLADHLKEKMTS